MPLKAALWYVLLLALGPAVVAYWGFLAFPPGDVLRADGPWELGYSILCIVILLLFLWRGVRRRLVFSAYIVTLLALYLYAGVPSLDRIVSFIAYSALFGIAFEFYRQNRPLYDELRASGVGVWRIVFRATLLWSPMLLFVLAGVALNNVIVETTKTALYASTLVDRYCVIRDVPGKPVVPCADLEGRLTPEQLNELSLEQNVALHVERTFLFWKKKTLEEIDGLSPEQLKSNEAAPEWRTTLYDSLKPVNMFGLAPLNDPRGRHYSRDPGVIALDRKVQRVDKQMAPCRTIALVFIARQCEFLSRERKRLLRERAGRISNLKAQERERKKKRRDENPARAYRGDLYVALKNLKPDTEVNRRRATVNEHYRRKEPPVAEIRAAMKVGVVQYLSNAERRTQQAFTSILGRDINVAYDVGVARRLCRVKARSGASVDGDEFDCPGEERELWTLEPLSFRENVDHSILRWHARAERDLERQLVQKKLASASAAGDVMRTNEELWKSGVIPPDIGLEQKRCGLSPKCHVFNWAKEGAEDAYDGARGKLKEDATRAVNKAAEGGASNLNQQIDLVRTVLYDALGELRRRIDDTIEGIARGGAIVSAFLQLWLFLVVIKSVLYVLATEVFNVKSIPVIGLESRGNAEGSYTRSTNIEIPAGFATPMQTSTVGINQGKRTVIPQPFRGLLSRIIHGKWILNRGTHAENATMRFTQPGGRVGIDWQLSDGEEVVFRYRDLLGFSENVELRTTISLRLSTLLFGRYIYHSARCVGGPGRLLLSVKGDVEPEQQKVETFPLERLIAWNMHTRFRVTDERTIAAVFKDGFTIRRVRQGGANSGLVLVGAPLSEEPRFEGTMRFVKTFLMPV